jgi:hypothetical protein
MGINIENKYAKDNSRIATNKTKGRGSDPRLPLTDNQAVKATCIPSERRPFWNANSFKLSNRQIIYSFMQRTE